MYSFALYPEEHQPSCACNFSRIANTVLLATFNTNIFSYLASDIDPAIVPNSDDDSTIVTTIKFSIYATRYDVLRLIGGIGGLAYKYMV
jgi:Large eukaryotic DNA virus major capsid protein.